MGLTSGDLERSLTLPLHFSIIIASFSIILSTSILFLFIFLCAFVIIKRFLLSHGLMCEFSLELLLLVYIRSLREGNFQLYVETLTQLLPWMFALDHTHYSRWLSVHVCNMMVLSDKHPAILAEFCAGKFVVHKTMHKFSTMAIDQCHEQNNALIKGSG